MATVDLRALRNQRGWSQAALAEASGVPRPTVSAIETGRVVPSVEAALALARALGTTVERMFGQDALEKIERWARPVRTTPVRFWRARVGPRLIAYPAEPLLSGVIAHDGILAADGSMQVSPDASPDDTLVIATCDPTVGVLAEALARRDVRLIALPRPSKEALRLLRDGLVHIAGVHFSNVLIPDGNQTAILRMMRGKPQVVLQYSEWECGIAVASGLDTSSIDRLLDGTHRWVNRPTGSGARAALDRLIAERAAMGRGTLPPPGYELEARDHRAVAEIIASGCAEAGIVVRAAASEAGLHMKTIDTEMYDLCIPEDLVDDRRVQALLDVAGQRSFRRALGAFDGQTTRRTGATADVA